MTTLQARKDPAPRGVSPTPSKIPVRSRRRPPLPTDKPCAPDQENQDPREKVHGLADPRPKATGQAKKSERMVGSPQLRNPLEELRSSPGGQNVGLRPPPPPQTEAPGTIEFVADPAALATILSGEGVKSCHLGRQSSLAQRVLIRSGTMRRGQGVRASAYLPPRTPINRLDPARASCFSRLEGSGPRGRTLCPGRLEAPIPSSRPSFHPSTRPSFQELRRETSGSSRTSAHQATGLQEETPVHCASSLPGREHKTIHSGGGGGGLFGLAQRVPLRETGGVTHTRDSRDSHLMPTPGRVLPPSSSHPSPFGRAQRIPSPSPCTQNSNSALHRLAVHSKTQFTPITSAPRVQQAQQLSGFSPQSCLEEPALPWVTVRLFDQETCLRSQEGPRKPPVATPYEAPPSKNPNCQELKMQHIIVLQQLLQQEAERLVAGAPPAGGSSSLDMLQLQPLLAEISRTLNGPEHNPDTFHLSGLSQHSGLPKPCLLEEHREPQPDPGAEPERLPQPGPRTESERQSQLSSRREPERSLQLSPETKSERPPEPGSGNKSESPPEPGPGNKSESPPQPGPGTKSESPPQPGPGTRSESPPQPDPEPEPKCPPQPDPKAEPERLPQPSPRTESKRQAQLSSETGPKRSPQPSLGTELEVAQPCPPAELRPPGSWHRGELSPPQAFPQEQTGLPKPFSRDESKAAQACSLKPRDSEPTPQPRCTQRTPVTSNLMTQRLQCASPQPHWLHSLKPAAGLAGPSSRPPRALALRQRLKACLTAIHSFHEACLDNECAFYTSRVPPSGPPRACTNPVATLLDWQDALCFVPIGSVAVQGSPS
ncbi:tastin isoform X2 [Erinaceus europaeus]|uniref:Tastin isoform X2 n=1 Tax=Erinaceus europaeus TaxID=9365 RepID=A0ABM3XRF7_ERIEU|nr:tastin isoform X2 [Erinaceus europaeus]